MIVDKKSFAIRLLALVLVAVSVARCSGKLGADQTKDLFTAAATGDLGFIQEYLDAGGSPEARRPYDATVLFYAAKAHNLDAVEFLLGKGANPFRGQSPQLARESELTPLEWIEQDKADRSEAQERIKQQIRDRLRSRMDAIVETERKVRVALDQQDLQTVTSLVEGGCITYELAKECFVFGLERNSEQIALAVIDSGSFWVYPGVAEAVEGAALDKDAKQRVLNALRIREKRQERAHWKYVTLPAMQEEKRRVNEGK